MKDDGWRRKCKSRRGKISFLLFLPFIVHRLSFIFPSVSRFPSWFSLVVCVVGVLLAREARQPASPLAGIDRTFLDWLSANAAPARPAPGTPTVTLVEIDDAVAETPRRLPLGALEYASFLHSVAKYEPAVVAIVPTLDWAESPPGTEQILLDEAIKVPKLLLGVQLGSSAGNGRDPGSLPIVENLHGSMTRLAEFPEIVETPGARLAALATAAGVTNLPGAVGMPMRDLPLLFRCRERVVPGFALETLALALRLAPSEVSVEMGSHVQLGVGLRLPIDGAGRALLDARAFGRVNRLSLDDLPLLVVGQATPEARAAAGRMHGGVVIIGRTDKESRTLRRPGGQAISPAEALAWAAASLEETPATRRASAWWDAGIIAVWAAGGTWTWGRGRREALVLGGAALSTYALLALAVFAGERLWLPCALPIGLTAFASALAELSPQAFQIQVGTALRSRP